MTDRHESGSSTYWMKTFRRNQQEGEAAEMWSSKVQFWSVLELMSGDFCMGAEKRGSAQDQILCFRHSMLLHRSPLGLFVPQTAVEMALWSLQCDPKTLLLPGHSCA